MFQIIKNVCRLNSEEMASQYMRSREKDLAGRDLDKTQLILSRIHSIQQLCEDHGIRASFGTVSIQLEHTKGERIDVSVFVQTFAHDAPSLTAVVHDLARAFDVKRRADQVRVVDPKGGQPQPDFLAEYFVSGDHFFAVNPANAEILTIEGKRIGGLLRESDGRPLISWNLEIEPSLEGLIHEIVQVKLEDEIDEASAFQKVFPEIQERIKKHGPRSGLEPSHAMETLKEEHSKIFQNFSEFDEQLHGILGDL